MSTNPPTQDQTKAKHHYVTRAYLDNMLARGEKRLWVYERNSDRVFRNIPANLASARAYYTTTNKDGVEQDQFEKLLAADIEGPGIPVIRKLSVGSSQLSMQEIAYGAMLIATQELRVPFKMEQLSAMMKAAGESFLKSAMSRPGVMESAFQELKDSGKINPLLSADEMRRNYDEGGFDIVTTTSGKLWALGTMLRQLINTYAMMKWTVLIAPEEMIVTSDCPVCRDYPVAPGAPAGVVNPDLTLYFPISPTRVVVLQHDVKKWSRVQHLMRAGRKRESEKLREAPSEISYKHISKVAAGRVNKMIVERAMRWVYSPVEMPDVPKLFRGESRNVRVEIEKLDDVGTVRVTHRLS